jgi:hypothetical protein
MFVEKQQKRTPLENTFIRNLLSVKKYFTKSWRVIVGFPNGRNIGHILRVFVNEFLPVISVFIGHF